MQSQVLASDRKCREMESEMRSMRERLQSLRKLNTQYEAKMRSTGLHEHCEQEMAVLNDRCRQYEDDNRELTRHLKQLLETATSDSTQLNYYKQQVNQLEAKLTQAYAQSKELSL